MDTPELKPQQTQQQLPHLVVEEPKRSKWAVAGIAVLSLIVLSIPIGLFLVQQRTDLTPQAAVSEPEKESTTGIILESKLSPQSKGAITSFDVYIKSSQDAINLAKVNLKFDPSFLSVDKIATGEADLQKSLLFNKWLEVSYNNSLGTITLIAGSPSPGIKTAQGQESKVYFATVNLKPKNSGTAVVQVKSDSLLLRNSDNQNLFQSGNDLVINISSGVQLPEVTAKPSVEIKSKNPAKEPVIVITNPRSVTNYSYFKPIDIIWSAFNAETISQINLYVNGEFFGPVAQNLDAKLGNYSWEPKESLPLPYIQLSNTFMIEVVGIGKSGESAKAITGPFGILGQNDLIGNPPNPEFFSVNPLSIDDASRLFSNYLVLPMQDKSLDFNKDEVINELDFYLLKQNLLERGIIR